jgi:hypothetical protein
MIVDPAPATPTLAGGVVVRSKIERCAAQLVFGRFVTGTIG